MKQLRKYCIAGLLLAAGFVPAQAFDCTKAESPVEKAICADQKLKAADDAMAAAYATLRNALTGADRKSLAASQRKWLKGREDNCSYQQVAELSSCILSETDDRRLLLTATPESGPGSRSAMMPVFIQQDGDPHHYDIDYTLIRFVKPKSRGETVFNAEVGKIAKAAPLQRQKEASRDDMTYSAYAAMTLTYASPQILSGKMDSWDFSGGAHGNGGTSAINVDLARGAMMKASDLFDDKGTAALKADCVKQIAEQKKDKNDGQEFKPEDDPNYHEQTIVDHMKSLDSWSFWKDKAVVNFDAYSIGSYVEGSYECEFPTSKLKSLAKSGALLPE
jgi:uncharacterized protein YecT (DUF1311 family)